MSELSKILLAYQPYYSEVINGTTDRKNLVPVNLSATNIQLMQQDLSDTVAFSRWFEHQLAGKIGWGGYMEHREMYRRSRHFDDLDEPRSLHLGIDLWTDGGTPVYCPIAGTIHSIQDNAGFGNYGPTVILAHNLESYTFYTLYGHLSRADLSQLTTGDAVSAGAHFAHLGGIEENGGWPPHLHFQVITDLLGFIGDFPGVAKPSERGKYERLCPDPNLILRCK